MKIYIFHMFKDNSKEIISKVKKINIITNNKTKSNKYLGCFNHF